MSVPFRAAARLDSVGNLHRLSVVSRIRHQNTRIPTLRYISWMPFEQPDPSLYPPPPSLQPKRPIPAEAVSGADDIVPQTTMVGRVGATPSTARTQGASTSGKPVPTSVPASAMQTGPTPLSQIQKRTFTVTAQRRRKKTHEDDKKTPASDTEGSETAAPQPVTVPGLGGAPVKNNNGFPTLHIRLPGHPALSGILESPEPRENMER
ncbi:hypothetical protein GQX73_g4369 [Xylaria multiplex]|uniref:Uncharacterized protein n=1 Tax=Xylaria multiplex TaxID=323545 RepID=A0A7C8MTN8_9PEZI|nr:hypothetical protein GQX73_g4369 [Xylaria multiplex]